MVLDSITDEPLVMGVRYKIMYGRYGGNMRIEFINEKKTEWLLDGSEINLSLNDVISSQYYENESIILYLIGRNSRKPDYLVGYKIDGKKIFKVPSPDGLSSNGSSLW